MPLAENPTLKDFTDLDQLKEVIRLKNFTLWAHRGWPVREETDDFGNKRFTWQIHYENTTESFKKAVNKKATHMELDVWVTSDGEIIVFHDDDFRRLNSEDSRSPTELTAEEILQIDLGYDQRIPSLKEVLDALAESDLDQQLTINVELKGPNTAEPVAKLLAEYLKNYPDKFNFVVSSFNWQELENYVKFEGPGEIAVLYSLEDGQSLDAALQTAQELKNQGANVLSINMPFEDVSATTIEQIHQAGFKAYVWYSYPKDCVDPWEYEQRVIANCLANGTDGAFVNCIGNWLQ